MRIREHIQACSRDEAGGTTAIALSLVMGGFMLGGLALDVAYAYKSQNELRIAADAAGHAALYVRQEDTASAAKAKAIEVAKNTLPTTSFGTVLDAQDIQFGHWDYATQTFTADATATDAVMVSTKRYKSQGNAVRTFMLNFLGIDNFDVRADSVFVTHYPTCLSQGFAAKDTVDVQSNNTFYSGFCIHSNNLVSARQNNKFEAGVIISMPDTKEVKAGSGNDGLQEALRDFNYNLRILKHMDGIWTSLLTSGSYVPSYITNSTPVQLQVQVVTGSNTTELQITTTTSGTAEPDDGLGGSTITSANLLAGRVYLIDCGSAGVLTITNEAAVKDVVILTACAVEFADGAAMENALLMTKSTSNNSVTSAANLRLGVDDTCAAGGGAQILTYGSVRIPAGLEMYGGQIIAKQDIAFAANADGIEGVSFIAGGKIDGTSNASIKFCKSGMEQNFELPFFRLGG